jgi:hypothetical protein
MSGDFLAYFVARYFEAIWKAPAPQPGGASKPVSSNKGGQFAGAAAKT